MAPSKEFLGEKIFFTKYGRLFYHKTAARYGWNTLIRADIYVPVHRDVVDQEGGGDCAHKTACCEPHTPILDTTLGEIQPQTHSNTYWDFLNKTWGV